MPFPIWYMLFLNLLPEDGKKGQEGQTISTEGNMPEAPTHLYTVCEGAEERVGDHCSLVLLLCGQAEHMQVQRLPKIWSTRGDLCEEWHLLSMLPSTSQGGANFDIYMMPAWGCLHGDAAHRHAQHVIPYCSSLGTLPWISSFFAM